MEAGDRSSWAALKPGTPCVASGGEQVGTVKEVLAVEEEDIFEGIIIETHHGDRYVDEAAIDDIFDHQVLLKLDSTAAGNLPAPTPGPGVLGVGVDEVSESKGKYGRERWFKRAWNRLSGKY
jgi:hypothetical protein